MSFRPSGQCPRIRLLLGSLLLISWLLVAGSVQAQRVTLEVKEASLESVLSEIKAQTGIRFIYTADDIKAARLVTLQLKNVPLKEAIQQVFNDQPFTYHWETGYVVVKKKTEEVNRRFSYSGRVVNTQGEGIGDASVVLLGHSEGTRTDPSGMFRLESAVPSPIANITSIGYVSKEVPLLSGTTVHVELITAVAKLDEQIVIAYGVTTRRLSTGSVSKVSAEDLSRQPVSNVLEALHGRVPGLQVTQSTGLPGASVRLQLRGRTALDRSLSDDQPLIVIDGIPYAPNNGFLNTLPSAYGTPFHQATASGGISPLSSLNIQDIESIEVLKDADATSIYGSRGANGVLLITTKKSKAGETRFTFSTQQGWSRVTNMLPLLSTNAYRQMRKKAFINDGVTPTNSNAYDLLLWDSTRYTDFNQMLLGGTGHSTDIQGSVAGGNGSTQFLIGGSYRKETTVYPGSFGTKRGSGHFTLNHSTKNNRFKLQLSGTYASQKHDLLSTDLAALVNLPPNLKIYETDGNLAWNEGGVLLPTSLNNPLASLLRTYQTQTNNLLANMQVQYGIARNLTAKIQAGVNGIHIEEAQSIPLAAQNPLANNLQRSANFSTSRLSSVIVEPQLIYSANIARVGLEALLGTSMQSQQNHQQTASGSGYSSDALLQSLSGAATISGTRSVSEYRYAATFGRLTANWDRKYLLTLSGRRDGSSRFGPDRQFANFWSVGSGWVFTSETWMKKNSFISFGKLRASLGTTGNDKISDYQYLDTWSATFYPNLGGTGLVPSKLFNPDFGWEKTTKVEIALDLGFLKDRVLFNFSAYRNRSSNQLVQYKQPTTTGFTSIVRNLPAEVENRGLEISLSAALIKKEVIDWSSLVSFSIPQTRLRSFPGLALSSYASSYLIGKPLNMLYLYRHLGVDPTTGQYITEDVNADGLHTQQDYQYLGSLDPLCYGGWQHTIRFQRLEVNVFLEGVKQTGRNYFGNTSAYVPGSIRNLPTEFLSYWNKAGETSDIQKLTQSTTSANPTYAAFQLFNQSNGIYGDASYLRLKNVSLAWELPLALLKRVGLMTARLYFQGQNLFTFTNYRGGDPETQNFLRTPPLRNFTAGIQCSF